MGLSVVDRDKQVAYWQLIFVAENRPQRLDTATASGSGTVRIAATPMPSEENLRCNKEGYRGPPPPQRDMCGKVMTER